MRFALFIGDMHQAYESEVVRYLNKYMYKRNDQLDIFANCSVPTANFLHVEGLKSVFYLPDLDLYDGIILADDTLHHFRMNIELREHLKEAKCPIVNIRSIIDNIHSIVIDNKYEMYKMTKHIIDHHGITDIGFVTGLIDQQDAIDRLDGFTQAMNDSGLSVDKEDIFHGDYWKEQGPETLDFFLKRSKGLPRAIICSNDYMAIALSDALHEKGYVIPDDVIITGVDNISDGDVNVPALTTIDISMKTLINKSVETIERMNRGEVVPMLQTVEGASVFKASCGCKDIHESVSRNYNKMVEKAVLEKDKSRKSIYMGTDFGGALNDEDCIKWTFHYLVEMEAYDRIYMMLDKKLVGYYETGGEVQFLDEPIGDGLVPDSRLKDLEGRTNVFFPIQCKDEIYGNLCLQLRQGVHILIDERVESLLINIGNTIKRLRMYYELFSVKDVMKLYLEDPLTGIYNRRGFERRMDELFARIRNENTEEKVAVASIDIDKLKPINDTYGHFEGDRAITTVANCISRALKDSEFVARMGGDEFEAVLLITEPDRANVFRGTVQALIEKENADYNSEYDLSVSIGISEIQEYNGIMESMQLADEAMYAEKKVHHISMELK